MPAPAASRVPRSIPMTSHQCSECGARYADGDSCADRFNRLLGLDHSRQEFEQLDGATLFTNDPGIKAALDVLSARWPWTLSRQELVDAVHDRLRSAGLRGI